MTPFQDASKTSGLKKVSKVKYYIIASSKHETKLCIRLKD